MEVKWVPKAFIKGGDIDYNHLVPVVTLDDLDQTMAEAVKFATRIYAIYRPEFEDFDEPLEGDNYKQYKAAQAFLASPAVGEWRERQQQGGSIVSEWKQYKRKGLSEMRPYVPGEDLSGVSVNKEDTPELGGMVARNPDNHQDQWYVSKAYFEKNLTPA